MDKLFKRAEKSDKYKLIEMKYMEVINKLIAMWVFTSKVNSEGAELNPMTLAGSAFELGYHAGQMDMEGEGN